MCGRSSEKCHFFDLRCVWCFASGEQAHARTGDVPFYQRLYGQGRGYRNGSYRTTGFFFGLFLALPFLVWHPGKYAEQLAEKNPATQFGCVAGQYGLVGRWLRRWQAHYADEYPLNYSGDTQWCFDRCGVRNRSALWFRGSKGPVQMLRGVFCLRVRHGPIRLNTMREPRIWRGCLRRISSSLRMESAMRS